VVEMVFADTGIGIPEEQLERVFDEFTQVDGSSTRAYGGTGLGLPLAKRLVELMSGRLTLTSVLGKGTTVRVLLPAATW
jgi:signal transduction histidine kinase